MELGAGGRGNVSKRERVVESVIIYSEIHDTNLLVSF